MLAGIGECLADNRQGMIGHLLGNHVVDLTIEGDLGTGSEGGSQLVRKGQNGLTESSREAVVTEFEDGTRISLMVVSRSSTTRLTRSAIWSRSGSRVAPCRAKPEANSLWITGRGAPSRSGHCHRAR